MICGAAHNALGVRGSDHGHVRNGAAVEADGEEMGLVVSVQDCISAAFFVDVEGAEGGLRHGEFSQIVFDKPRSVEDLLYWTSRPPKTRVIFNG